MVEQLIQWLLLEHHLEITCTPLRAHTYVEVYDFGEAQFDIVQGGLGHLKKMVQIPDILSCQTLLFMQHYEYDLITV